MAVKRLRQRAPMAASAFWLSRVRALPQAGADDRLVTAHCGLGERAAVVVGLLLPSLSADFDDAGDGGAAGGRDVRSARRRADRSTFARRDYRLCAARQDGGVAVEAVIRTASTIIESFGLFSAAL